MHPLVQSSNRMENGMEMFSIPVGINFIAGEIDESVFAKVFEGDPGEPPLKRPKNGIVVWYEDDERCKTAMQAAIRAHWPCPQEDGTMTAPTGAQSETSA